MEKLFIINTTASPVPRDTKILSEKAILQSWTNERAIPNDGTNFQECNYYCKNFRWEVIHGCVGGLLNMS